MKLAAVFSPALAFAGIVLAHPLEPTRTLQVDTRAPAANAPPNCFPALGFTMPSAVPSSLTNWWCSPSTEYAFVGFSYEVTECQSLTKLRTEFLDIRQRFKSRYVRLYGFCDRTGFYNDIVDAAWRAGVGVQALIWFGFDGTDEWIGRRDTLFATLHSNPKAKFVTRAVQFGSEPLFDWVLNPRDLITQVNAAKKNLSSLQIPVTVSDLAYSFKDLHASDGGPDVLKAIDYIDAHILPFFSTKASIANNSWPIVLSDLNYFISQAEGKKIWFSQNGWPSKTSSGVQPNSPSAVANVQNEQDYYKLLDKRCADLKAVAGGGVGWFAHIYSDNQEPGYGIYSTAGSLKFPFAPKTSTAVTISRSPTDDLARYLQNGNILAARTFILHFTSALSKDSDVPHVPVGSEDEVILTKDAVVNFSQLAVLTCQRAQGDKNKVMRESWVRLCGTYQSRGGILASPEVRAALNELANLYFAIPPPRSQAANPFGDMLSSLFGGPAAAQPTRRMLSPAGAGAPGLD
ncbi:hypothetical protein D9615_005744 [Tricholomella constricta]|uniref:glucan endo-1,3-beta-D-glucosidase n=1 Tax=Tricholomella constricta TaxID=117010 RepID=A0A8H5M3W6_9AGAR|nr:hypothetical protein D9615_005744 [Tricholomella constricta]